ncbi:fatty acid/sphingolipid desaturase [Sparassis latifolia]
MGVPTTTWTRDQIAARILAGEAIFILHGKVIRVPSSWLTAHPGGTLAILHFIGRDATDEVEAFHSDETLAKMQGYAVGTVDLGPEGWFPLVPPIMNGWVRKLGKDGAEWYNEARAIKSLEDTELSPASQILLVEKDSISPCSPTLSILQPPPTPLSTKLQVQHSKAYKALHKRVVDAGLYKTPWLTGYGPEFVRYTLLGVLSAYTYSKGWIVPSAICLGLLWHQLTFFAHDLGHLGVTQNWALDRIIGIFVADLVGGLSIGWWVDNHNIHHLMTNHPSHDPDIQHLPFFAISPVFLNSLYSTYYKRVMYFDSFSKVLISIQHKLFHIVLSLARFNLYVNSYSFLAKTAFQPKRFRGGRWWWWLEIISLGVYASWYSAVVKGCGTVGRALLFVLISHVVASPVHVQIVLSHFSRSTADLGVTESFAARQLRTTVDVICPPSLAFIHGGLHLQVTHHMFPRLPRHNLLQASMLVKEFAKEQGMEFAEFGFVEGNGDVRGVLKQVADQVKIVGMVADAEIKEAMICP